MAADWAEEENPLSRGAHWLGGRTLPRGLDAYWGEAGLLLPLPSLYPPPSLP